jgi:hypothetical protein
MRPILFSLSGLALLVGCENASQSTTVTLDPVQLQMRDYQGTFDYMADSALLADMTLSDYHFLPDRPILTPLGEQRLRRLAALIDAYGGAIRFNTDSRDPVLVAQRTATTMEFLKTQGVDTTVDVLVEEMPGSAPMQAKEAILIKRNEGMYDPQDTTAGAGAGLGGIPITNP